MIEFFVNLKNKRHMGNKRVKWDPYFRPPQKGITYFFVPGPRFFQIGRKNTNYYILAFRYGRYIGIINGEHVFKGPPIKNDGRQKKYFRLTAY